ncbi:hypothetical protein [Elizabethkingia anophelis]|uniref:hypothetical protein n=1 Tax=Elizabethkingia anophelis TaxID=1117645 RepID=UPI0012B2B507|nr:hypothetical protein [Elizabethkingia anophelis]MDV3928442.1 hypothetical protein [Elizabethkingia anophelis]MDV4026833.1 hypothetical protein [Elizabethkingia anophelis]QGN21943.1 hypothetical protein GJV56_04540 [Elizabethkingia anophelis]QGN21955.1 hypothetical protein GJV56_04605 [Elizabethkingia anophelis]QNV08600.1 hypothetical protein EIY88_04525 [Elizabethkingia anophelis]
MHNVVTNKVMSKDQEKKRYLRPTVDVIIVEMECGIAANSAPSSPVTVNGNTEEVPTDWNGNDDTSVNVPF